MKAYVSYHYDETEFKVIDGVTCSRKEALNWSQGEARNLYQDFELNGIHKILMGGNHDQED